MNVIRGYNEKFFDSHPQTAAVTEWKRETRNVHFGSFPLDFCFLLADVC